MRKVVLRNPKKDTKFYKHNNRLALFHKTQEHDQYWRKYWSNKSYLDSLLSNAENGYLGEFETIFNKYIPPDLSVLEAGCGPAHFVIALGKRGFHTVGIDYEPEIVNYVNSNFPNIDVRRGDVRALDFPSQSFGCYISIGVIEHFEDGYEAILSEAHRILHPRGIALISVPYLNPLRRKYFCHTHERKENDSLYFHQYYFSLEDFSERLKCSNFMIIEYFPYAVNAFLTREHSLFSELWRSKIFRVRLKRIFNRYFSNASKGLRVRYGHMVMFVCRPVQ